MTAPLMRDRATDHRRNRIAAWGAVAVVILAFLILGAIIGGGARLAFHLLTK